MTPPLPATSADERFQFVRNADSGVGELSVEFLKLQWLLIKDLLNNHETASHRSTKLP